MLAFYISMLETEQERDKMAEIYEEHRYVLLKYALKITSHNQEMAEDAVHNAIISIIKEKDKYFHLDSRDFRFSAVIIVRNKCIDLLRKEKKYANIPMEELEIFLESNEKPIDEQIVLSSEYAAIRKHISSIDEISKQVFLMKYAFGMSYKEIGEKLSMTPKHVDTRTDSSDNTSFIKAQDVSSAQVGKIASTQSKLNLEGSTEISDFTAGINLVVDSTKKVEKLKTGKAPMANIVLPDDPRTIVNGTLTVANDFHFFSVTGDKFLLARLVSVNADYWARLYIVDYETSTATPTNIWGNPNDLIQLNGLPQGDYAFIIGSNGTLGNSYSLQINATNPAGNIVDGTYTSSLQQFVLWYSNSDVYTNGTYVCNVGSGASTAHLDWEREYYFSYGGNYSRRTHNISDVKILGVSGPYSYSSSYASSNNVMFIYLDVDTLFTYFESQFQSDPHYYYASFDDILGKTTPRRLEADDYSYGDHILVYDLNTGTPIDFYSVLNFYYGAGVEALPTITQLN